MHFHGYGSIFECELDSIIQNVGERGADYNRRVSRVRFIERILKEFGFRVKINEDCIIARLEGYEQGFSIERLKVLGYLTVHTRQLDMIMANHATVNYYIDQMLNEIYSFVSV